MLKMIIGLSNGSTTKGIGFNDIRTRQQILTVNIFDDIRLGDG